MAIMDFTRLSHYLLILTLSFLSSPSQTLGTCSTCSPAVGPLPLPLPLPPVTVPPVTLPPVIEKPPVTVPVINPPATKKPPCAPPKPKPKPTPKPCPPTPVVPTYCPIDTIKFGCCLDILGAVVRVGDPVVECCSLIEGITSVQAAVCLCTIIKAKALGIHVFFPIAIELLVTCGKTPPPGYKCF